jgi:hypothetical protein
MGYSIQRILTSLLLCVCCSATVLAQSVTQVSPGLAGEKDARGRNPELFVTRVHNDGYISLLVDAHVPHPDYQQYPIKFEYYINRKLFTSQIRSEELPGALGVDIGPDIASPPFNYAVVATLMHPHRATHSMVVGAVFSEELSVTLNCTVTSGGTLYTVESTNTAQSGNDQFAVNFLATSSDGSEIRVGGTVGIVDSSASGNLQVVEAGTTSLLGFSGSASKESNTLTGFSLETGSGVTISCE